MIGLCIVQGMRLADEAPSTPEATATAISSARRAASYRVAATSKSAKVACGWAWRQEVVRCWRSIEAVRGTEHRTTPAARGGSGPHHILHTLFRDDATSGSRTTCSPGCLNGPCAPT